MALLPRAPRLLARVAVVAATAVAVTSTGLGGVALAGTPTVTAGAAVLNDGPHSITVDAPGSYLPGGTAKLTLTSPVAGDPVLTATDVSVALDGHTITATFDYRLANPGAYDLAVFQTPASPTPTDSCSDCVTVNALKPTVSGVSPSLLGSGTTGGGYQDLVISGQSFARGLYSQCTATPCANGTPRVAVYKAGTTTLDPNVTLTQTVNPADGTPAPTAPTATTITLRVAVSGDHVSSYQDDVVVINSDNKTATCSQCLTIAPRPVLTKVAHAVTGLPSVGEDATGQTLRLEGFNIPSGSTVSITNPSETAGSITYTGASGPTVVDGVQVITLTGVDTTAATTRTGWVVSVSHAGSHATSASLALGVNPKPVATDAEHLGSTTDAFGQGAQDVQLRVSGTGFTAGTGSTASRVVFTGLPAGVTVTGQTATATAVTVDLDVAPGTTVGSTALQVVNPDGGASGTCDNSVPLPPAPNTCVLTVATGPTISSLAPSTMTGTGSAQSLVVNGTGFHTAASGVRVVVSRAGVVHSDKTHTADSATKITTSVTLAADLTAQDLDVTVVNVADQGLATSTGGLHVANLAVTGATPSSGTNDAPASVTVNGNHLAATAAVSLVRPGSTIPATGVTGGGTSVTGTFDLTGVSPGAYDVVVTNPAGDPYPGTASCTGCFTVVAVAPTVATVSPSTLGGGATGVTVTLTGTGFFPGATLSFSDPKVHVVGTPEVTSTSITAVVSVDASATTAAGTVTVTNTDGQSASKPFSTNAAPGITTIAPAAKAAGTTFTLTVTGARIASGAQLSFSHPSVTAGSYAVNGDGTQLTAEVTVPADVATTAPTAVQVALTNPDHGRTTSPTDLVVNPQPTVTAVSPDHPAAGSTSTLHVTGTGFQPGATLAPQGTGTGLQVSNVTVTATEITATLTVEAAAAAGERTLVVTNTDGGSATGTLSVITVPGAPTGVTATPGVKQVTVAWSAPATTGGSAVSSYTVTLTKQGEVTPVASFTSSDASTLSHDFTGLLDGTAYQAAVVATNAAGNSPKASASATTFAVPSAPTTPAATAGVREVQVTWGAPASDGGTPVTSYTLTLTPSGGSPVSHTTADGTTLSRTFTGLANGTTYTASVVATNAVGASAPAATGSVTTKDVPTAPQGLSATGGIREIGVTWQAPAADGGTPVTSYTATVTNQANPADTATFTTADATTLGHTFSGLANGATYTVTVKATNAAGSSPVASGAATTFGLAGAPASVSATGGVRQVDVTWAAPTSDGGKPVTGYSVSLTGPSGTDTRTVPSTTTSQSFASLANGTTYTVTVRALTLVGAGSPAQATASTFGLPSTPAVTAVAGDRKATVSWTVAGNGGTPVTGYRVVASPGGATVDTTSTSATVTGLTNGTAYTFTVTATNAAGESSGVSSAVTPMGTSAVGFSGLPKVIEYGTPLTFTGRVGRTDTSVAPGTVTIRFRLDGGSFTSFTTLTADSAGYYGYQFRPSRNASYVVVYNGDAKNKPATSVVQRTLVAPRITVSAPSGSATTAQVVSGTIRPLKGGYPISLYKLTSAGTLIRLQTVTLSSTSAYRFAVKLPRGRTTLVVIMPATPGNTNNGVLFQVTRT